MSLRLDIQSFLLDHTEEVEKYGGVVLAINIPYGYGTFIYLERTRSPKKYLEEILEDFRKKLRYPWDDAVLDLEYTKRLYLYLDWIDIYLMLGNQLVSQADYLQIIMSLYSPKKISLFKRVIVH